MRFITEWSHFRTIHLKTSLPSLCVQPAVDRAQLQRLRRLSFQVVWPLSLQTVPRGWGGQRWRLERHLCQLQWIRPGRRQRQLLVRLSGGTWEEGKLGVEALGQHQWGSQVSLCCRLCLLMSNKLWLLFISNSASSFALQTSTPSVKLTVASLGRDAPAADTTSTVTRYLKHFSSKS